MELHVIISLFLFILLPICLFILLAVLRIKHQEIPREPPGPQEVPIFGNVFSLRFDRLDLSLFPLAQQYGKIFQINILGRKLVVLNDVGTIRKALLDGMYRDIFSDRADHFYGKYNWFDHGDVIFGKACRRTLTLRKILTNCIKVLINDKHRIHDEILEVIAELKDSEGTDVDIVRCLRRSAGKWIASLVTGRVADDDDAKAIWDFINANEHTFNTGLGILRQAFPFVRYLPGKPRESFRSAIVARDKLLKRLFNTSIDERGAYESTGLIHEIVKQQEHENNKAGYEIVDDLRGIGLDIFDGVVDIPSTALKHVFAFLLTYPEHVQTIQTEIDNVVGRAREPSVNDKAGMPFLIAFILESQRFTTQAPLGVPLQVTRDVIFEGYSIQKHTSVLINYWFVHHDERIWGDPWNFRPQRFLDSTGQLLSQEDPLMQALMPFSIGPRSCPGQVLAMNRMFLFVASILQCFTIYPSATGYVPETDPRLYKIRMSPEIGDYRCRFELRS